MTAVEVVNPTDRYTISGIGYGLDGQVQHAAGSAASIEDAIVPYLVASDAKLVDGKVVGDPTEGALLVLGYKAGIDIDETREKLPRLATLPFDPTYKLMATFNSATDAAGQPVVRCFVKGAAPAVMARAATALSGGTSIPWDAGLNEQHRAHMERMEGAGRRVMAAATRDLDAAGFDPVPGTERELPCDLVLLAMGFTGAERPGLLAGLGVDFDQRGNVARDGSYATSVPGVFVAGDMGRGQSLIVWAIAEGRSAAAAVDRYLGGVSELPAPIPPTARPLT